MENFDLKSFETRLNTKLGKLLNKQVSIKKVGAFGTAVVLASTIGFGKLILDKNNITLKQATEITELSSQLNHKNEEISNLELQLTELKKEANSLEAQINELISESNETENNLQEKLDAANEEIGKMNDEIYKMMSEPFLAVNNDRKQQFSLESISEKNKLHLPENIYNINVGDDDIDYYDYFELNIPASIDVSFNGLEFNKKYEFDREHPNQICCLVKDLAVVDKKNNRIYFNENFKRIYIEIYNYYRSNYDSQKTVELMEKFLKNINYVSVKTIKDYSISNGVKPNIIELNHTDAYTLNYMTDSLVTKIMENNDILISMHDIDPDYYVGKRTKLSSYQLSLSRNESNLDSFVESGKSRGL